MKKKLGPKVASLGVTNKISSNTESESNYPQLRIHRLGAVVVLAPLMLFTFHLTKPVSKAFKCT